jgi:thioredoxin 1
VVRACRRFAPVFEAVDVDNQHRARFARCNIDENPPTAAMSQIPSIPTLIVFGPDGSEFGRLTGAVLRHEPDLVLGRYGGIPS